MKPATILVCLFSELSCGFGTLGTGPVVNNHFEIGMKLFHDHYRRNPEKNFLISPAAIESSVFLLLIGFGIDVGEDIMEYFQAKDLANLSANYFDFMRATFNFKKSKKTPQLHIINQVFHSWRFTKIKHYKIVLRFFSTHFYSVSFHNLDSVASYVNNWLSDSTLSMMEKDTVPSSLLNMDMKFLLINSLHLKARFERPFPLRSTQRMIFTSHGKPEARVLSMVTKRTIRYGILPQLKAEAFELPYKYTDARLLIIFPMNRKRFEEFEEELANTPFEEIIKPLEQTRIKLHIPKFSLSYATDLAASLSALGLQRLFNFTADRKDALPLTEIHAVSFDINELGTKIQFRRQSLLKQGVFRNKTELLVEVSSPFAFFVYLPNALLFAGHVLKI